MAPQTNPPGTPDPNKVNPNEGEGASGQNPPAPPAPPAAPALTVDQMKVIRAQFGADAKILSLGPNTVVVEGVEVTKDETGEHRANVTRKIPRPQ